MRPIPELLLSIYLIPLFLSDMSFNRCKDKVNYLTELFADFSCESSLPGLSGFDFSAGEFPPALPLAISSLGGEYLTVFDYDCCYYFDSFHRVIPCPALP